MPDFRTIVAACVVFSALTCLGQKVSTSPLHSLYENHKLFALRDAVEHGSAPLFYRGVVEAALNHLSSAQTDLKTVIHNAPYSPDAYDAQEILAQLYLRNGMYAEASRKLDAMLKEKPNEEELKSILPTLNALRQYPDQSVVQEKPSTIPMLRGSDGSFFLPVTLNGKNADFFFDSGTNMSMMSESEAKRLGLSMHAASMKIAGATGIGARQQVHVGVAKSLTIGNLHLKNVAFVVMPDTQEPFVDWKPHQRGILGIPVLLAMQTFRWSPKRKTFSFGFSSTGIHHAVQNLLFEGTDPIVQVGFQRKQLEFILDTGGETSILYPPFAKEFPELLKAGQKTSRKRTGYGGSRNYDSILLSSLTFQVSGYHTVFKPAYVLLQHSVGWSSWAAGDFGMDQLNQASTITVDFRAMLATLQ